jgi:hypothetical protein
MKDYVISYCLAIIFLGFIMWAIFGTITLQASVIGVLFCCLTICVTALIIVSIEWLIKRIKKDRL